MKQRCDACEDGAIVHLVAIDNGKKKEVHLCAKCAQEKGLLVQGQGGVPTVAGPVAGPAIEAEDDPVCPGCGCAYSEFRSRGRFGCAGCYAAFDGHIDGLLKDIHNHASRHIGKGPGTEGPSESDREILDCRRALAQAIEREAYEDAARLRDRLEALRRRVEES